MGREEKWAELGATSSLKTSHVGPLQGSQLRREEWDPRVHSLMTGARILSASIRLALLTFQAFCPSLGPGAHLVQSHLHWSLWVLDAGLWNQRERTWDVREAAQRTGTLQPSGRRTLGEGRRSRQGGLRHMAESELQPARRAWKHTGRKTRLEKTQSGPHHDGLECLAEELNLYAEGSWETWKFLSRELRT